MCRLAGAALSCRNWSQRAEGRKKCTLGMAQNSPGTLNKSSFLLPAFHCFQEYCCFFTSTMAMISDVELSSTNPPQTNSSTTDVTCPLLKMRSSSQTFPKVRSSDTTKTCMKSSTANNDSVSETSKQKYRLSY